MTFRTIKVAGKPWMVCEGDAPEIMDVIRKCGLNTTTTKHAPATPEEKAVLVAERVLAEKEGRNPDNVFGVRL